MKMPSQSARLFAAGAVVLAAITTVEAFAPKNFFSIKGVIGFNASSYGNTHESITDAGIKLALSPTPVTPSVARAIQVIAGHDALVDFTQDHVSAAHFDGENF